MSTFNYRLLIDALSDRGFEHCKSQVYPLLDYQFLTFEEVRKVDFCETVHDLTELYLSKAGPKGVAALEFYLSAVENSIVNTVKCKRGSLAEEYKNHALKLIKDLKGKSDEESEEKYEKLLTVFSIYLSLLRETFPDFVRKEAAEVSLMVNGCDEELLKKVLCRR